MLIAALVKRMSYLTMSEKVNQRRKVRRCACLSLGILGIALLLVLHPFHDRSQTQRPFHATSENNAFVWGGGEGRGGCGPTGVFQCRGYLRLHEGPGQGEGEGEGEGEG